MSRIVLTGGGTAGHVTSNLALYPRLCQEGYEVSYIGSYSGIEKKLAEEAGIPYYGVDAGKFRRYRDLKNLTDPFHVLHGVLEARKLLKKLKPDIIFSKGGFVAVPVVWAAQLLHIPVVSHESDMTPGLANKLTLPMSTRICCNFPETMKHLPEGKAVLTGAPIRAALLEGSREEGLRMTGFSGEKPVLMIIGGSLGSVAVNQAVRALLPKLLPQFDMIHVAGKGNLDEGLKDTTGYRQYEYLTDGLRHLYALADIVISRAGANVICELLALQKPNILIPLPKDASRGDQILNAESFRAQGFSVVVDQHEMERDLSLLYNAVEQVYENRADYIAAMKQAGGKSGVEAVLEVLEEVRKGAK